MVAVFDEVMIEFDMESDLATSHLIKIVFLHYHCESLKRRNISLEESSLFYPPPLLLSKMKF